MEHAADAGLVTGERDIPEPALRVDIDPDIALFPAGPALGALEVGEDGDLAEAGHGLAPALARGEEGVAPARVHQEPGAQGALAVTVAEPRGHAVGVEDELFHGRGLEHAGALADRVVEEDLVELRAMHVEGEVRPGPSLAEGEGGLALELLVMEGDAELVEEPMGLDLVEHAQPGEDRHAVGHQRLTDLEAREDLALHHGDVETAAGEEGRGGGAPGPAAHDKDVGVVGVHSTVVVGHRCP